jgi:hypothetical protein
MRLKLIGKCLGIANFTKTCFLIHSTFVEFIKGAF